MEVTYKSIKFTLSDQVEAPHYFVLGVRKSGSSILNTMVSALAKRQGVSYVDVPGQLFKAGLKNDAWRADPAMGELLRGGNLYGGFRNAPVGIFDLPAFKQAPKILMVRDPRDALVSEYFSNAYSHSLPVAGEGRTTMERIREEALASSLESYVLERAEPLRRTMAEYTPLMLDPNTRVFRYEDVILHKRALLTEISRHFKWPVHERHLELILGWADVIPDKERPQQFVRRVVPGDHRDKLSGDAIRRLNLILQTPMRSFGYDA
jgi:hypothetical protein